MTKIYLITGYLGSGKTTFLNQQLRRSDEKVGVLVNEFGKISIDSITIKKDDVVELNNGSIFCSCLKDNFIKSIKELLEMDLDTILIEASGLSDPSNMKDVISILKETHNQFVYEGAICIIDAQYFLKVREIMLSVDRQVLQSNHIIINKIDTCDKTQLNTINDIVNNINKFASVTFAKNADVNLYELPKNNYKAPAFDSSNTESTKPFSVSLQLIYETQPIIIQTLLKDLSEFVIRAKGYISHNDSFYKIDLVSKTVTCITYDSEVEHVNHIVLLLPNNVTLINKISKIIEKHIPGVYNLKI